MNLSPAKWFSPIIVVIALVNITCFFDIPVLRQVSGFIFLAFIPGFFTLLILRLNRLGLLEKIILTVGLSISFSLFFGLALNALLRAIGYDRPLSMVPLLVSFSLAAVILAVIAYLRNRGITFSFATFKLTNQEKAILIMPALFPLLSIVGMRVMNLTDNNVILMTLLFLIPAYIVFILFYRNKISQSIYPVLIYFIGISLLLMLALRSNHIVGSDIHEWYYVFQMTLENGHWRILGPDILDACLSISLLPAIYQNFLNMNTEYLFKLLYPVLCSISPLVVYIIAKKYIGDFWAFLASLFFMSQVVFLSTTGSSDTSMAVLFFGLSTMVLFHDGMSDFNKRLLFIIFAASCIVSHYSATYIFFFILLLTWIGMVIIPRILPREKEVKNEPGNTVLGGTAATIKNSDSSIPRSQLRKNIAINTLALFVVMIFFWYSQITIEAYKVGLAFLRQTLINFNNWFLLESRVSTVTAALGVNIDTIPQHIRVVVSWITVAFIGIGVLGTLVRYKKMMAIPGSVRSKLDFLNTKFEMEFLVLALACSATVVFSTIMPYIDIGYSMERVHFQTLVVLSLFFVIGGILMARLIRVRPQWIIVVVLVPFLMCTTGTMYQIFNVPVSINLNSEGREYELLYIRDTESYTAKWLGEYGKAETAIYSERESGLLIFMSQGNISRRAFKGSIISHYEASKQFNGYINLTRIDETNNNLVIEYPDVFAGKNKIYTNRDSEIYS